MTPETVKAVTGDANWMSLGLATRLHDWLATWKPKRVVELGTLHGVSCCYFAAALQEWGGHITTVDLPASEQNHPHVDLLVKELGLEANVRIIRNEGGAIAQLREWFSVAQHPRIDLLYIDANHSWEATVHYWALGSRLVKPGGWVIFDDVGNDRYPQVAEAFERIACTDPAWHNAETWPNWGLIQKR